MTSPPCIDPISCFLVKFYNVRDSESRYRVISEDLARGFWDLALILPIISDTIVLGESCNANDFDFSEIVKSLGS